MNNLNKKMSLVVKLMTLAVMMNIATGCDACKDKDSKKGGDKASGEQLGVAFSPIGVAFSPKTNKDDNDAKSIKTEVEITNGEKVEFVTENSDYGVLVEATIYTAAGKIADPTLLDKMEYKVGTLTNKAGSNFSKNLKDLFKDKIEPSQKKKVAFEIEKGEFAKLGVAVTKAEFKFSLKKKDGGAINSDTFTWIK